MPFFTLSDLPTAVPLPHDWLDSTEVAPIALRQETPEGLAELAPVLVMRLTPRNEMPLCWEINRQALHRDSHFLSWTVAIDAASGEVVFERLGKLFDYSIVPVRQRFGSGEWQDLPLPEWVAAAKQGRV